MVLDLTALNLLKEGVRLLEFDIRHPFEPRTQMLEFGNLVGKPSSKKPILMLLQLNLSMNCQKWIYYVNHHYLLD